MENVYAILGDLDAVINDRRKVSEILLRAREYFFLDTSLTLESTSSLPPLVLIVFSITNDSNETDIPKQETPEGPGREIGFRLRGRINARGRLIRQY